MGKDSNGRQPDGESTEGFQLPAVAWSEEESAAVGASPDQGGTMVSVRGPVPDVAQIPAAPSAIVPTHVRPDSERPDSVLLESNGSVEVAASPVAGAERSADTDLSAESVGAAGSFPATESKSEGKPGRISKPMIAAAATAGAVLIGLPLVFAQLGSGGPDSVPAGADPARYIQQVGGGNGFIPGADTHGSTGGGSQGSGGSTGGGHGSGGTGGGSQGSGGSTGGGHGSGGTGGGSQGSGGSTGGGHGSGGTGGGSQ
ncbi:hypothetical protein ACWD7F_39015, partial [Streptomyces sp. NPDC005122]